jgi:hypothetical protein
MVGRFKEVREFFSFMLSSSNNQICQRSGQVLFVFFVCHFGICVLYHDRANVSISFPRQSNCYRLRRTFHWYDGSIFWYIDSPEQHTIFLDVSVSIFGLYSSTTLYISKRHLSSHIYRFLVLSSQILHNPRSLQ